MSSEREIARLRRLLEVAAPAALAAYDANPHQAAVQGWQTTEQLFPKDLWEKALSETDREMRVRAARRSLAAYAADHGVLLTGFSEVEEGDPGMGGVPIMEVHAQGYEVRP